jgi:hypothetical protein
VTTYVKYQKRIKFSSKLPNKIIFFKENNQISHLDDKMKERALCPQSKKTYKKSKIWAQMDSNEDEISPSKVSNPINSSACSSN